MFMPAMILIRLTSPTPMFEGRSKHFLQGAVDAEAHADHFLRGLDVDIRCAVALGLGEDPG